MKKIGIAALVGAVTGVAGGQLAGRTLIVSVNPVALSMQGMIGQAIGGAVLGGIGGAFTASTGGAAVVGALGGFGGGLLGGGVAGKVFVAMNSTGE
jgi:hypothetical protein